MSWTIISVILFLMLLISGSLNIFLIWYGWKALQHVRYYDEELTEVVGVISTFTNHLKSVYELEIFYGDETLRNLLKHAQDLTTVFDQYDLYSEDEITEEEEEEEEELTNDYITEIKA